jgi:hypothetical protein
MIVSTLARWSGQAEEAQELMREAGSGYLSRRPVDYRLCIAPALCARRQLFIAVHRE